MKAALHPSSLLLLLHRMERSTRRSKLTFRLDIEKLYLLVSRANQLTERFGIKIFRAGDDVSRELVDRFEFSQFLVHKLEERLHEVRCVLHDSNGGNHLSSAEKLLGKAICLKTVPRRIRRRYTNLNWNVSEISVDETAALLEELFASICKEVNAEFPPSNWFRDELVVGRIYSNDEQLPCPVPA